MSSSTSRRDDPHASDPLPPGWTREFSQSQKKYFYHCKESAVTQWHFPTASEAKNPLVAKERAEQAKARDDQKQQRAAQGEANNSSKGNNSTDNNNKRGAKREASPTRLAQSNNTKKKQALDKKDEDATDDFTLADRTSVAIIVPYRDLHPTQQRAAHLKSFVPHMIQLLKQAIRDGLISDFFIYIIEQSDDGYKFNRGKLLNIGFDLARKQQQQQNSSRRKHDVFIFHDVDLLPANDLLPWYAKFPQTPIHIARVWDRYSNNPKYFGGVVSFSLSDYKRINGVRKRSDGYILLRLSFAWFDRLLYQLIACRTSPERFAQPSHRVFVLYFQSFHYQYPNNFFGWGGEDDEMQRRLEQLGIQFVAPDKGTLRDLEEMTVTEKMEFLRQNKEWKCMVKWELKEEHKTTWKTNGLNDLKYTLLSKTPLDDGNRSAKFTVEVKLNGDHWTNEKAGVDFVETSWKK